MKLVEEEGERNNSFSIFKHSFYMFHCTTQLFLENCKIQKNGRIVDPHNPLTVFDYLFPVFRNFFYT